MQQRNGGQAPIDPADAAAGAGPALAEPGRRPVAPVPGTVPTAPAAALAETREAALAREPARRHRHAGLFGSISLRGGRIDDVALKNYRETVDPRSPNIVLFSPSGSPNPYYAEFGWVGAGPARCRPPTPSGPPTARP